MNNLELTDEELKFIYSHIEQAKKVHGGFAIMFQEKGLKFTSDLSSGLLLIASIEKKILELDPNIEDKPLPGWEEDPSTFRFEQ